MAEPLYCCVDGGGSKTRVALFDAHGLRLGIARVGPSSLTLLGEQAWDVILEALRELCVSAGVAVDNLSTIHFGIGLAGVNNSTQRARFIDAAPTAGALHLATDAYIAALGAHNGAPGAIVIVGTGSVGYRFEPSGRSRFVGGWGFPIGDEGSGAWLGRAALAQALRVWENRHSQRATALHRALIERCGHSRSAVMDWLHGATATKYAGLAPLVIECANRGDPAALQLAKAAGVEIDALALALDPGRRAPLALVGGLVQPLTPYLPSELRDWIQEPHDDPIAGALILAQGRAPDENLVWDED